MVPYSADQPAGPITFDAPIMGESIASGVISSPLLPNTTGVGPMVPYSAVHSGGSISSLPMDVGRPVIWYDERNRPRDTTGFDPERDRPRKYYLDKFGPQPVYGSNTQGGPKLPRIVDESHISNRKPSWFNGTAQEWHGITTRGIFLD